MVIRALFVREEGDTLVLGGGVPPEWLASGQTLSFGPTLTSWGWLTVVIDTAGAAPGVRVESEWRERAPRILACLAGHDEFAVPGDGARARAGESGPA